MIFSKDPAWAKSIAHTATVSEIMGRNISSASSSKKSSARRF
jgi:hypothetical protein